MMQAIYDFLLSLPFRFAYMVLDFLNWVLSIIPAPSINLQSQIDTLPVATLQLLGYCGVWTAAGIVAGAFGIRAVPMLLGR